MKDYGGFMADFWERLGKKNWNQFFFRLWVLFTIPFVIAIIFIITEEFLTPTGQTIAQVKNANGSIYSFEVPEGTTQLQTLPINDKGFVIVNLPNGEKIAFPDTMSDGQILSVLRQKRPQFTPEQLQEHAPLIDREHSIYTVESKDKKTITFRISSPEGKIYEVSAPKGVTTQQAFSIVQKILEKPLQDNQINTKNIIIDEAKQASGFYNQHYEILSIARKFNSKPIVEQVYYSILYPLGALLAGLSIRWLFRGLYKN